MITPQSENKAVKFAVRYSERKVIYTGEGITISGIPARDMTAEEAERYGGIEFLVNTGLYSRPQDIARDGG